MSQRVHCTWPVFPCVVILFVTIRVRVFGFIVSLSAITIAIPQPVAIGSSGSAWNQQTVHDVTSNHWNLRSAIGFVCNLWIKILSFLIKWCLISITPSQFTQAFKWKITHLNPSGKCSFWRLNASGLSHQWQWWDTDMTTCHLFQFGTKQ